MFQPKKKTDTKQWTESEKQATIGERILNELAAISPTAPAN